MFGVRCVVYLVSFGFRLATNCIMPDLLCFTVQFVQQGVGNAFSLYECAQTSHNFACNKTKGNGIKEIAANNTVHRFDSFAYSPMSAQNRLFSALNPPARRCLSFYLCVH